MLDRFIESGPASRLGSDAAKKIVDLDICEEGTLKQLHEERIVNGLACRSIGSLLEEYKEGVLAFSQAAAKAGEVAGERYEEAQEIEKELNSIK